MAGGSFLNFVQQRPTQLSEIANRPIIDILTSNLDHWKWSISIRINSVERFHWNRSSVISVLCVFTDGWVWSQFEIRKTKVRTVQADGLNSVWCLKVMSSHLRWSQMIDLAKDDSKRIGKSQSSKVLSSAHLRFWWFVCFQFTYSGSLEFHVNEFMNFNVL